jgi:uncharacterized RDD family membrane protein YckC
VTHPPSRGEHALQGHRAWLVTRVAADAVDLLVVLAAVGMAYLALGGVLFVARPAAFHWPNIPRPALVALGWVILVLYLSAGWSSTGRTLGKQLMGLRVVGSGGELIGIGAALVRALLCTIFPIGLLWCAVSGTNRSLQDLLIRTSVIYDWAPRVPPGGRTRREDAVHGPTEPGRDVARRFDSSDPHDAWARSRPVAFVVS